VRPREVAPTAGGQSWVRRAAAPAASRRDAAINCSRSVRRFRQQAAGSSPRSPTGHAQVAGAAFPYPNPSSINFPIKLPKHRMRYIPPLISPSQPLFPSLQTPPVLSTRSHSPLPSFTPLPEHSAVRSDGGAGQFLLLPRPRRRQPDLLSQVGRLFLVPPMPKP
jgi:hypothetical protein